VPWEVLFCSEKVSEICLTLGYKRQLSTMNWLYRLIRFSLIYGLHLVVFIYKLKTGLTQPEPLARMSLSTIPAVISILTISAILGEFRKRIFPNEKA
jgi:hypothetical protein